MRSDTAPKLHTRWAIKRDLAAVLAIEADCPDAWGGDDYLTALARRDTISMLTEDRRTGAVLGAMVYRLFPTHLKLLRLAVAEPARRAGVGQELVAKLAYKCCSHRREAIYCRVPDDNLPMQLFLRACAFRAVAVVRDDVLFEFRAGAAIYEKFDLCPPDRIATREGK